MKRRVLGMHFPTQFNLVKHLPAAAGVLALFIFTASAGTAQTPDELQELRVTGTHYVAVNFARIAGCSNASITGSDDQATNSGMASILGSSGCLNATITASVSGNTCTYSGTGSGTAGSFSVTASASLENPPPNFPFAKKLLCIIANFSGSFNGTVRGDILLDKMRFRGSDYLLGQAIQIVKEPSSSGDILRHYDKILSQTVNRRDSFMYDKGFFPSPPPTPIFPSYTVIGTGNRSAGIVNYNLTASQPIK